jgi:hypothetical protein
MMAAQSNQFAIHVCLISVMSSACLSAVTATAQQPQIKRQLAPGVVTTIPSEPSSAETFQGPHPVVELILGHPELDWKAPDFPDERPNYTPKSRTLREMAQAVTLRREIWNLEFSFKPLRQIEVDVPQSTGKMQKKLIWYLVYRVRYNGNDVRPAAKVDRFEQETFPTNDHVNYEYRRFFPHFVLENFYYKKQYLDRIIPAAKLPILLREFPSKQPEVPELAPEQFYNAVEISEAKILRSDGRTDRGVWGFVTWESIDPRLDYFALFIKGLTNAYRFVDPPGAYSPGDPPGTGRTFVYKTLQLNFYRPGDAVHQHEGEIRFGVPVSKDPDVQRNILDQYGLTERLDHRWLYRGATDSIARGP